MDFFTKLVFLADFLYLSLNPAGRQSEAVMGGGGGGRGSAPICVLKILSRQKRGGVWKGTIRAVSISYTIADVFFEHLKGLSFDLNFKKLFSAFSGKKTWSPFLRDVRYQKLEGAL